MSAPENDWIEWKGGKCPVAPLTRVDVRFREGIAGTDTYFNETANYWVWGHGHSRGEHADNGDDIIAFRVRLVQP